MSDARHRPRRSFRDDMTTEDWDDVERIHNRLNVSCFCPVCGHQACSCPLPTEKPPVVYGPEDFD